MQQKFEFFGHVDEEGRLKIHNPAVFAGLLESHFSRTNVVVTIEEQKQQFKDNLRGYYFGVLLKHAQEALKSMGMIYSLAEIDEYFRDKFLATEVIDPFSWEITRERTSLKKSKSSPISQRDFKQYCEHIIQWVIVNCDYPIPYPNEELTNKFYTNGRRI